MAKQSIVVKTEEGDVSIEGADVKRGLAIHPTVPSIRLGGLAGREWNVTHVHSGMKVNGQSFWLKRDAVAYRDKMLGLGDWTKWKVATDIPLAKRKLAAKIKYEWQKTSQRMGL